MSAQPTETKAMRRERGALHISLWIALVLSALGITTGVAGNSEVILFDGFYTLVGVGLTSLALRASALSGRGPNARYPFGREALVPLVIAVEGVALSATCLYAAADAVVELVRGGTAAPNGLDLAYAIVVSVVPSVLWWRLGKVRGSELVDSETQAWGSAAVLGVALVAAFLVARSLLESRWHQGAAYVDPSLVLVAAGVFVVAPLRMLKRTLFELVEGSVSEDVATRVSGLVHSAGAGYGLSNPVLRMSKVGRKVYVEVGYVVPNTWGAPEGDRLRQDLRSSLGEAGLETWLTLEFSLVRADLL